MLHRQRGPAGAGCSAEGCGTCSGFRGAGSTGTLPTGVGGCIPLGSVHIYSADVKGVHFLIKREPDGSFSLTHLKLGFTSCPP